MGKKALILVPLTDEHKKSLEKAAPSVELIYRTPETATVEEFLSAEIVFGTPIIAAGARDIIKTSKSLEWIQLQGAGADLYLPLLPENTIVTTAAGSYGLAIAECAMGTLLSLSKHLYKQQDAQRRKEWLRINDPAKPVYGSTVLVVGMGDVGAELAKRLKAMGASVIGMKRTMAEKPDFLDELHTIEDLDEVLPRVDTVVLCLPNTSATDKIINAKTLKLMKKDAILINVGRGNSVNEDDLCDAMENGHLWGAGLDVFQTEPLPAQSRLWDIERVLMTFHSFGGFRIEETLNRMVRIFENNLVSYIDTGKVVRAYDYVKGY